MSFTAGNKSPKPVWQHDEPLVRGMSTDQPARMLQPGTAASLVNMDLDDFGWPRRRHGTVRCRSSRQGLPVGVVPVGLGELDAGPHSKLHVMPVSGNGTGGVYTVATPDAEQWQEALTEDGASFNPGPGTVSLVQGNELLFIIADKSSNLHVLKPDGLMIDCADEAGSPPRGAIDAAWLFQRIWLLVGTKLYWSKVVPTATDLEGKTAFDRTLDVLELSPPFGGTPRAIVPWNNQFLIVFYDRGIQAVSVNNSEPNLSSLAVIESRIGCASREAIFTLGNGLYFMDQYGQYRVLGQTISGLNEGILKEPVSEPIKKLLPGDLNKSAMDKTFTVFRDTLLYVYYASGVSEYPNACMVYDTARQSWVSQYTFSESYRAGITSNILTAVPEIYLAGSADRTYSRFERNTYSDNGVNVQYAETTRQYDWEIPELDKMPRYLEAEGEGASGFLKVYMRTREGADFQMVASEALTATGDFPLIELGSSGSQFPLGSDDFPLTEVGTSPVRLRYNFTSPQPGDFPLYPATFSIAQNAFPVYGKGTVIDRGRFIQLKLVEEDSSGSFVRQSFRIAAFQENPRFAE